MQIAGFVNTSPCRAGTTGLAAGPFVVVFLGTAGIVLSSWVFVFVLGLRAKSVSLRSCVTSVTFDLYFPGNPYT